MKDFGVVVPIVSPCTRTGELDLEGLKAICTLMREAGCAGIFIGGSTGRGPWFSRNDRARMCSTVAEHLGPDFPLFAGCMAAGLPDMLENARAMAVAGARVAVVTAPGFFGYSHKEIEAIFLKFADASPLPVMLYDIPSFAGMKLDLGVILRLARHGNVIGLKDSSGDVERLNQLLPALADLRNFSLFLGKEHILAEALLAGASGMVVSFVHFDPRPFVALYRSAKAGDVETAQRIQREITRMYDLVVGAIERRPEASTLFHIYNSALRERGVCENILLEHEGDSPDWLSQIAKEVIAIAERASGIRVGTT